jgi:hypothetical protein
LLVLGSLGSLLEKHEDLNRACAEGAEVYCLLVPDSALWIRGAFINANIVNYVKTITIFFTETNVLSPSTRHVFTAELYTFLFEGAIGEVRLGFLRTPNLHDLASLIAA